MKKKFLTFLLAICLILPCAFALTACGKDDDKLTKTQYLTMLNDVSTACENYLSSIESEPQVLAMSYTINNDDYEEVDAEQTMHDMIKANIALIYLVENIYSRDDYAVNNGVDEYIVSTLDWTARARMQVNYNKSTNITTITIYWLSGHDIQYFIFDINYNYSEEELNSFTITGLYGTEMSSDFDTRKFKYENGKLYMLKQEVEYYSEFKTDVKNKMLAFRTFNKQISEMPDYSIEYADACERAGI